MINNLFSDIFDYFQSKKDYFDIFIKLNTRYEGWMEAEIFKFLSDNHKEIQIRQTKKKYNSSSRPDLVLEYENEIWIVELKALLLGQRSLNHYLEGKGGTRKDFRSLEMSESNFWIIMFLTPYQQSRDESYREIYERVSNKYHIRIIKELSFYTPQQKQVKLILWGK